VKQLVDANDETFMTAEELRQVVQEKQEGNQRKRVQVLEEQDKLLWELALALKRTLVDENGPMTMKGVAISQISVQSVLDKAEREDPQPENWIGWISEIYRQE
jgi:ribonuclease I